MMKFLYILFFSVLIWSCTPDLTPPSIPIDENKVLNGTKPLPDESAGLIEGVYRIKPGGDEFGGYCVIKKSGEYYSVFCGKSISYFILLNGYKKGEIYFEGYWRFAQNSETGSMSLSISPENGATEILNGNKPQSLKLIGTYNIDGSNKNLTLEYQRPLNPDTNFYVIAHRGGGRNSDRLPSSENTVEMIKYCQRLGVNGIEIDLKLTKDNVVVLYHDELLNKRLINEDYFIGKISDFSYNQLKNFVTLKNGERIPKLEDALDAVLESNTIKLVWLDIKDPVLISHIAPIQKKYLEKASKSGKRLEIYIGLPEASICDEFVKMQSFETYPALCELDDSYVQKSKAKIWAPRWSLGLQSDKVNQYHSEGRKVFVWTLDVPDFIQTFIKDGKFDGILTNYPTQVAYEHYAKQ